MRGWLAAGMAAYIGVALTYRLGAFPALHGDEAWIGMFTGRLAAQGLVTLHGMTDYVGVLYGLLVTGVFHLLGPSVASLRLLGVAANGAAALLVLAHLWRRFGSASGLSWLYLLGTSSFFLFESRLAWEVCALQNLFLAVLLLACRRIVEDEDTGFWTSWVFLQTIALGVHNHFIFISVPVSLVFLLAATLAVERDWRALRFFRLSCAALAMVVVLYVVQPLMTDERWMRLRWWVGPLLILLPAFAAGVFVRVRDAGDAGLRALFGEKGLGSARGVKAFQVSLVLGLVPFFIVHGAPLLQIWSNVILFKRMVSWDPPHWVSIPLHLWAGALLGTLILYTASNLKPEKLRSFPPYERFLLCWPVFYAALFIIFRHTNSIRYYLIPSFLLMVATAVAMPRAGWLNSRRVILALAGMAVFCNVLFWREMRGPRDRKPFRFNIGWHHEKSGDFLSKDRLFEFMRREGICTSAEHNSFIDIPLQFMMREHPFECRSPEKRILTRYCYECPEPPYMTWEVRDAAARP